MVSPDAHLPVVFDVDEASFERLVLERSRSVPVLVDFWAPWCGPCRSLSPVLEELARAGGGRWALAKLNTDENPNLAQHFGIRGIPNVKAISGGRFVDEFTGALPRAEIEAFLARILPSPEDEAVREAEALAASGDTAGARTRLEAVLADAPGHERARIALAELRATAGELEEARALVEGLIVVGELDDRLRALQARLSFGAADASKLAELRARVESDPRDLEARLELGRAAARAGDYDLAGESLLAVLERDRSFADGAAQGALRDLLALLGDADPRTDALRRRMASILFS